VCSRAGLNGCGKSHPHRDSIPGPSRPRRVAIPIELRRPTRFPWFFTEVSWEHFVSYSSTGEGQRYVTVLGSLTQLIHEPTNAPNKARTAHDRQVHLSVMHCFRRESLWLRLGGSYRDFLPSLLSNTWTVP
jgi:hypothetical protein